MSQANEAIEREVARRLAIGARQLSVAALRAEYRALGYTFDDSDACESTARIVTGDGAGDSYPVRSLYPLEADTRRSAWHFESRRDDKFKAFQKLRNEVFAISRGRIVDI